MTIEILRLAQAGDFPGINRLLNDVIVPLYAIRNRKAGYKCSMIKTAMELCGLPGGRVRSPLIEMSAEDRADLDALLRRTNLQTRRRRRREGSWRPSGPSCSAAIVGVHVLAAGCSAGRSKARRSALGLSMRQGR